MSIHISQNSLIKWALFIFAIALTVYLLPKDNGHHYNYEVNRPWAYSLLTAPFDIPVHLDSVRAQAVRDSIERVFEPVYYRDANLEKTAVSQYANRLNLARNLELTPLERNQLLAEVKAIFENGIVDPLTYAEITSGALPQIRMIHNNVAISISTARYNTARTAYAHLDSVFHNSRFQNAISTTKLSELLTPNILIDSAEAHRLHTEVFQRAMAPIGVVQQGERIIDKGDIVTPQLYTVLQTYEALAQERGSLVGTDHYYPVAGQCIYLLLLFGALYSYLYFFRPDYYQDNRTIVFLMVLIMAFIVFSFLISSTYAPWIYLVPFTMLTVIVVVFLDSRTAMFSYMVTVLACTLTATFPIDFIFLQFVAGVASITSIRELSKRSQLIRTAGVVLLTYSVGYVGLELMQTGTIHRISPNMFGYFTINAVFICFAYILVFILEKIFGFTSRVTLVELSDINHPVLRELSEECPGTFNHSMAVSNLASAAAHRIGANVQLVRAGALYHDIGKISNPAFFTENQHGVNPHEALRDPLKSASIVIQHVEEGGKRAEKAKLPSMIRDFIFEHHGAGKARYFYTTYCNEHPGEAVDPKPFTYPGPNPRSRETSIMMMADAVEAASRSMKEHTPEAIQALVNKIIDSQIAEGLHNDSPISFRDVKEIKEVFISRLRTMYHSRISYPELVKPTVIGLLLLMTGGSVWAQDLKKSQYQIPNLDSIRIEIQDRTSPYYYPRLMEEYERNDTMMKLDKYRRLYLGYMFQEDYNPYRPSEFAARLNEHYEKPNLTRQECDSVIKYSEMALQNNPFDLKQMMHLISALHLKGKNNLAQIWQYKFNYILMAIASTGTGLDEETAWYVIEPQHEYVLLNAMGLLVDGHLFYEPYYEFIKVKDTNNKNAPGGYYFNIKTILEEYYRKYPDALFEEEP